MAPGPLGPDTDTVVTQSDIHRHSRHTVRHSVTNIDTDTDTDIPFLLKIHRSSFIIYHSSWRIVRQSVKPDSRAGSGGGF